LIIGLWIVSWTQCKQHCTQGTADAQIFDFLNASVCNQVECCTQSINLAPKSIGVKLQTMFAEPAIDCNALYF